MLVGNGDADRACSPQELVSHELELKGERIVFRDERGIGIDETAVPPRVKGALEGRCAVAEFLGTDA
jgi:hypothetical protein